MAKNSSKALTDSPNQRIRASAIIIKDKKILLIHRFNKGREYYVFPGGGIEENESPEEAVIREVMEETSLKMTSCKLVFEDFNTYSNGNSLFFSCQTEDGTPILAGPESTYQSEENQFLLEWHNLKEVNNLNLVPESAKQKLLKIAI